MKYCYQALLYVCLFCISIPLSAQEGKTDSMEVKELEASVVKTMQIDPFSEDRNGAFPASRPDNWAVGLHAGSPFVGGEVRSTPGYAGGLYLQKSLGHTVSLRFQGMLGRTFGQDWEPTVDGAQVSYRNFRTSFSDFSLQAVVASNNINFFRSQVGAIVYGFGGLGLMMHKVEQNLSNGNGEAYNYAFVNAPTTRDDKSQILDALSSLQDDTYETSILPDPLDPNVNDRYINPSLILGAGVGFRLSRRVDLNLEYRASWHNTDFIDGFATSRSSNPTAFNDIIHYPSVSLAFKVGKGSESRWWTNPLATPYENIRQLNQAVIETRTDSDGDGVADYLDEEPYTAPGATVNTRGVTVETQDDLLLKVTEELGKLAENVSDLAKQNDQKIEQLRAQIEAGSISVMPVTIHFDYGLSLIKPEFYPAIQKVAAYMKQYPNAKVRVSGYTDNRAGDPYNQELAHSRINAAIFALAAYFSVPEIRFVKEVVGEAESLVPNLPEDIYPRNDGPHYLNRRVVFSVVE